MHDNLYVVELMAREKQKMIEREALRAQQIAEARKGAVSPGARLCGFLGDCLISAGEALKRRYQRPATARSYSGNGR